MEGPLSFSGNCLLCPRCGGDYLHQNRIEIFNRAEDATDGLHVVVDGLTLKADTFDFTQNPSSRRYGMTIYFLCETCPNTVMKMDIAQHKGNTYIEWHAIPIRETDVRDHLRAAE